MFSKLLKREFKTCLNYYLYCLALAGLSWLAIEITLSRKTISSSLSIMFFLVAMINVLVISAVQFLPMVRAWRGFYGKEAFFYMTLPASPGQQVLTKILVTASFIAFHNLLFITLFMCSILRLLSIISSNSSISYSLILREAFSYAQLSPISTIIVYILTFAIIGLVQATLLTYITVRGHSGRMANWPVAGTILTYIVFVIINILILLGLTLAWPIYLNFGDKLEILTDRQILRIFTSYDDFFILPLVPYLASIPIAGLLLWRTKNLIANKYELRS